jgi:hypothetical protein
VVYSKLKVFFQKDTFQIVPDRSIILPLLKNAYLERSVSLEKMGDDLWKIKDDT